MITARARVTGWNPLMDLELLHREMDRLLGGRAPAQDVFPALNLWSDENSAVLTAEVPGIDAKSVSLTVKGNLLTVEGERKPDPLGEKDVYHRRERGHGKFSRTIHLPYEVDSSAVKATYARGVLKVDLPRTEVSKPRKIAVEAE